MAPCLCVTLFTVRRHSSLHSGTIQSCRQLEEIAELLIIYGFFAAELYLFDLDLNNWSNEIFNSGFGCFTEKYWSLQLFPLFCANMFISVWCVIISSQTFSLFPSPLFFLKLSATLFKSGWRNKKMSLCCNLIVGRIHPVPYGSFPARCLCSPCSSGCDEWWIRML